MKRWEYLFLLQYNRGGKLNESLYEYRKGRYWVGALKAMDAINDLGDEGWELVSFCDIGSHKFTQYMFKREKL
jgi:hypothetical protein